MLADHRLAESGDTSAYGQSVPLQELDVSRIPQLPSQQALTTLFTTVREARFLQWDADPTFKRRIPWLYLEDGCFLRAERMADRFTSWGYPAPLQAMVFGELSAETEYGQGYWWYHVAPVYRVGAETFVIDPSLDFARPLPLATWILRMNPSIENVQVSVCSQYTLMPGFDCYLNEAWWDPADREASTQNFLDLEWAQLSYVSQGRPDLLLGEHPPWSTRRTTHIFNTQY